MEGKGGGGGGGGGGGSRAVILCLLKYVGTLPVKTAISSKLMRW